MCASEGGVRQTFRVNFSPLRNAVLLSIALSGHFLEAIVDKITWRESFDVVGDCFSKLFKVFS